MLHLLTLLPLAASLGPEIYRVWIEAGSSAASTCIVQFAPFTLHVAGRQLQSISSVVLVPSGGTCGALAGGTRFLSPPGKCSPEVPSGFHNNTGVFKLLCSLRAQHPGTGRACFSSDGGRSFDLSSTTSLPVTVIQHDTFAIQDGIVPPPRRLLGSAHVSAVAAGPEGVVIGGHTDGTVRLWDATSGSELWAGVASLDGAPITGVASQEGLMAVSSADGRATVWNVTFGAAMEYSVLRVEAEPSSFNTIAFSPNTTDVVAVGNSLGRVFLFRLEPVLSSVMAMAQVGEPVSALSWCPHGAFLVAGTFAGGVSWWTMVDLSVPVAAVDDLCEVGGIADLQCGSFGMQGDWVFVACTTGTVSALSLDQYLNPVVSGTWSLGASSLAVGLSLSSGSDFLAVRTLDSIFIYDTNETLTASGDADFWAPVDGTRLLTEGTTSWFSSPGPPGNAPFVEIDAASGTASFHPCWPLPAANRRELENITDLSCASDGLAPTVTLEVDLPWEFTAVRGSFVISSIGAIPAEDCRVGQLPITNWSSSLPEQWSLVRTFATSVGPDCVALDAGGLARAHGRLTIRECLNYCASLGSPGRTCNVVNVLPRPGKGGLDRTVTVCDLRRCDDVAALQLQSTSSGAAAVEGQAFEVWAQHHGTAFGGGYTALGTRDQVVYGGCGVEGGKIPNGGMTIAIEETLLESPQSTVRFQVAQSNAEERVKLSDMRLELRRQRPLPVRVIREPLVSTSGDSAVSANSRRPRESNGAAARGAIVWGQSDRDSAISPWLFTSSWDLAVAAFDLRGLYLQELPSLTSAGYMWWRAGSAVSGQRERNLAPYRPTTVYVVGVGLDQSSTIAITKVPYCGAPGSRRHHNAVYMPESVPVVYSVNATGRGPANLTVLEWPNVTISMTGEYKVCWCASSCCSLQDALWSGGLAGLLVVSGPDHDSNYHVCRWGYTCVISKYAGHGLTAGDRIRLSAFTGTVECTSSLSSIGYWPPSDPAIMTSRAVDGSEYRTEFLHGDGVWRDFEVFDGSRTGITILICWCRASDGCSDSAGDYKTPGGILALTRFSPDPTRPLQCEQHSKCVVYIAPDSRPLDPGDKLMIKQRPTDPVPSGTDPCSVSPGALEGMGASGRSEGCQAPSHSTQCLAFDFGIVDAETVSAGEYLACWCQGSLRPCVDHVEFSVSVSPTEPFVISPAQYVFPDECAPAYLEWRAPWLGYHDCCCNYKEAGSSPGCEDPNSEASRVCNDLRQYQ